jgi:hypothetical protein
MCDIRKRVGNTLLSAENMHIHVHQGTGSSQELDKYTRQEGQHPCRSWINIPDRKDRTPARAGYKQYCTSVRMGQDP